jgi:hypothetical protein
VGCRLYVHVDRAGLIGAYSDSHMSQTSLDFSEMEENFKAARERDVIPA